MNTTAEIYLWGTRVGIIHQDLEKPYASYEYDSNFLKSGIEISPIRMPLNNIIYEFPDLAGEPFFGMPGLVADSLPDSFGNKVIEQWLTSQRKSMKDFTAIDRLCYTGNRGMGALEYVPAGTEVSDIDEEINVSEMVRFASDVLNRRKSITLNAQDWLMKFDNVSHNGDHGIEDCPEYTLIEYAYYKMAREAGIDMQECRIYASAGENHFMTKRFDRVDGKKIHMQSLGALAHISYKEPRLCSYEMAAAYMREMNLPMKDIEQFYCRMVFNCLAVNQDDHVKNISFIMDRQGKWRLAPAYDVTYSYDITNKWLQAHQMTINGKKDGIDLNDLLVSGEKMGIKKKKCHDIIQRIAVVVDDFEKYASKANVREKTYSEIKKVLAQNKVNI